MKLVPRVTGYNQIPCAPENSCPGQEDLAFPLHITHATRLRLKDNAIAIDNISLLLKNCYSLSELSTSRRQATSSLFAEQWNDLLNSESSPTMEGSLTKTDEFSLLPSNLLDSHLMAASGMTVFPGFPDLFIPAPEIDNSEAPQKETLPVDEYN
ncbi:hypothetical protein M514_26285 [Trichuris suis]|uniref:Uncharacterized protein n=1 Tax=Trichuris suis TaxID=68888 RepID=A0A085MWE0_9BILA|nr:hypothetical protein M514_26285 [Trichuris suis]